MYTIWALTNLLFHAKLQRIDEFPMMHKKEKSIGQDDEFLGIRNDFYFFIIFAFKMMLNSNIPFRYFSIHVVFRVVNCFWKPQPKKKEQVLFN